jgi:tetratricopeptide (TPR) repeat protein
VSRLGDLLAEYLENIEDPVANMVLGCEYKVLGQNAAAISFFLRAANLSEKAEEEYEALLRVYSCISSLPFRFDTSKTTLYHCINLLPKRPEAYYLLAQMYEWSKQWPDALVWTSLALSVCDFSLPVAKFTNYEARHSLVFLKSVCLDHMDQPKEALALTLELANLGDMGSYTKSAVRKNLKFMADRLEKSSD